MWQWFVPGSSQSIVRTFLSDGSVWISLQNCSTPVSIQVDVSWSTGHRHVDIQKLSRHHAGIHGRRLTFGANFICAWIAVIIEKSTAAPRSLLMNQASIIRCTLANSNTPVC